MLKKLLIRKLIASIIKCRENLQKIELVCKQTSKEAILRIKQQDRLDLLS